MGTEQEIIGEEWAQRASELADWAMQRLVNRKDVWGQYSVLTPAERRRSGKTYKAMTLPMKDKRGPDMVTLDKLTRHFASRHRRKPQIIGLHAKSRETTSRWFAIDIDLHDESAVGAEDHARRNHNAAITWCRQFQSLGYDPMLFNSNGYGGFHIWVLLAEPAPTEAVFAYVKSVVSEWEKVGLEEEPETFPKKVKDESIGSWFRLPGLHHSRHLYSSLWSWDDWLDDPWLEGHAAIDAMLENLPGPPPPTVKDVDITAPRKTLRSTRKDFERVGKPTVCVDLDGVLAQPISGKMTEIGPPVSGALEFMRALSKKADITILTSRLATSGKTLRERQAAIETWLEEHRFPYDHLHRGAGKPVAHAYVDDRAVPCRPMESGPEAFHSALDAIDTLTGPS
ncbi:MAG: hypothetical protein AB8B63_24620 [Granulosicoccus sp.]